MKLNIFSALCALAIAIPLVKASGESRDDSDHEYKLQAAIVANLTKDVQSRPLQSGTNVTNVDIFTIITHIVGLDERTQTLTINGWMFYRWLEERAIWDTTKFGGLKKTRLAVDSVWKPMLYLYNSASFMNLNNIYGPVQMSVYYDGYVRWVPPYTSRTVCAMDLRWFPFDEHECYLEFGAWLYSGQEVNFTIYEYRNKNFMANFGDIHNEWELLKTTAEKRILNDYNDWHSCRFNIHLRRRATYYNYLLILPSTIGIFLCLVIFWLPANIKFITGSFNVLMLTILITHIYWVVPRSGSSAPNIIIVISNTLALAGVSILFSIITVTLSRRSKPDLPEIIPNYLSGWLGVILCMRPTLVIPTITAKVIDPNTDSVQMRINEQSTKTTLKNRNPWLQLATALDRIFFIIYCFTFFIIFIVTFTY